MPIESCQTGFRMSREGREGAEGERRATGRNLGSKFQILAKLTASGWRGNPIARWERRSRKRRHAGPYAWRGAEANRSETGPGLGGAGWPCLVETLRPRARMQGRAESRPTEWRFRWSGRGSLAFEFDTASCMAGA
jgi:hypothetical protein